MSQLSSPAAKRQRVALSPASSSSLAAAGPVTPGRDGTVIDDGLAMRWGSNCFRCGQNGHWYSNCLLRSRMFSARNYGSVCYLCGGSLGEGELSCFGDGDAVVHVRCQVGRVTVEQRANEARLTDASRAANSSQGSQQSVGDEDFVASIERCVEETSHNIGVNSAAAFNFIVQEPSGIMARSKAISISLSFLRYRIISVSLRYW